MPSVALCPFRAFIVPVLHNFVCVWGGASVGVELVWNAKSVSSRCVVMGADSCCDVLMGFTVVGLRM